VSRCQHQSPMKRFHLKGREQPVSHTDLRPRLRAATLQAHQRLDGLVDKLGFFQDQSSYARYLRANLRVRRPLELALDAHGAAEAFAIWPERRIATALSADLHDVTGLCGSLTNENDKAAMGFTPPEVMGVLYVLEGSALGARLLSSRASAIGMTATQGGRHLALQSSLPKAWPCLLSSLAEASFDADEERHCIDAAQYVFARFERSYDLAVL
jgi:heme oxygenase